MKNEVSRRNICQNSMKLVLKDEEFFSLQVDCHFILGIKN